MPSYRTGTVTAILSERPGLQRVEVEGERAYVLTQLIGPVAAGDEVVVNTTAVELGLGTGGWHVVHWNLSRREWSEPGAGHEMKLRYTSLQVDTGASQTVSPPRAGTPVVACFLHSQIGAVASAFAQAAPGRTLAYVMTEGGALPLALSDLIADLRDEGLLAVTVTAGQAFGGEREAVNLLHALELCGDCDALVVAMGPGSLGTGSPLGFSGIEVANVIDAADTLACAPIVALRYSDADPRSRHQGVSHHALTALALAHESAIVPIPRREPVPEVDLHRVEEVDVPDVSAWPYTSMGRTVAEDRKFFEYAAAAGVYAAQTVVGDSAP